MKLNPNCTQSLLLKQKTQWFFSPAGAPHFNGLAEAAVKSCKLHLKKTIGEVKLSYEELCTLLAQVEACVNSRPLIKLSSDPNDIGTLTPAHFLVGESLICPPEQNHLESNVNWLNRWQRVQQMTQFFWKRWKADYLNQLQTRVKWHHEKNAPQINDAVLILEENLPPAQWQTGHIVAVHPGDDGYIRVVSLKVGDNIIKRPITKICPFPKEETDDNISVNHSGIEHVCESDKIDSYSRNRRSHTWNVLPIITALLAIVNVGVHSHPVNNSKPFEISMFKKPPGLYFEHKSDAYVAV